MTEKSHEPYLAFKTPGFGRFFLGGFFIYVGMAAQSVAVGWDVYQRTGSVMALGLVGLVQGIPMLLFTLPAGYFADVYDRRTIMIIGLTGAAITSLALAVFSRMHGSMTAMYVLLFLDAAFFRLVGPSGAAIVSTLVPAESLENAIKWRISLFQVSSVVGPAVGGIIVAWSIWAAYVFNALTACAYIVVLLTLHVPDGKRSPPGRMFTQLKEGVQYVWQQKLILGALSLDLFAVLLGGAVYLLPVYAKDILKDRPFGMSPEQLLGWLRAAPACGASVMALIIAHRPPLRNAGRSLFASVAAFGVATIIFGVSRNFWLSFVMLFLTGFFDNISVVIRQTLVQLRTPNELRGRVSAVNSVFIGSSNELGGFESGLMARLMGTIPSVVAGGFGTLAVVAAWMKLFPELRRFDELDSSTNPR